MPQALDEHVEQPMRGLNDLRDMLFVVGGFIWILPAMILLSFLVIYVVGDIGGRREGRRDPLLGAKVFLTFLATVGVQTALAAVALLLGEFFETGDYGEALQEAGGWLLGGGIVAAYAAMAYYTRMRLYGTHRVLRQAVGLNAIVTGLVFAFALPVALHTWLNGEGQIAYPLSFTIVYVAANFACASPLLARPAVHDEDDLD
jgi:hypothetical protein